MFIPYKPPLREIHVDSDRYHLPDNAQKTKEKLAEVLETYDIIIMTGGVSKGKADYVPEALDSLGVKKLFHRVAQRPGKPFWFGQSQNGEVIFALPGNPVSTFMCFTRYLKPWLLQQTIGHEVIPIQASLTQDVTFTPALTYLLQVQLSRKADGLWEAKPIEGHGSGDLANLTHCNAFLELPSNRIEFKKGSVFPAWAYRILMCFCFLFFRVFIFSKSTY